MGLSFMIAVAIGVVIAALTWKIPQLEGVWAGIGVMASAAQSGFVQVTLTPQPTTKRVYVDGPIPTYYDMPLPKTITWQEYLFGISIDVGASLTSAAILIFILLAFVGGEEAKKMRKEIFRF